MLVENEHTAESWTGESKYGGDQFLRLAKGQTATFDLGDSAQRRIVEPVSWLKVGGTAKTRWTVGAKSATLTHRIGKQGVSAVPGALLPRRLSPILPASADTVTVRTTKGSVDLDAVLTRPLISRAVFTGSARVELLHSAATTSTTVTLAVPGTVRSYDSHGRLTRTVTGSRALVLAGGFTTVT